MTEYKDNEQYENDKAALIRIAEGHSMFNLLENADVIANLLKQSKWVGANNDYHKPLTLLEDIDTTTIPI